MAKIYLEQLSEFVEKATTGCYEGVSLECKHFFSGAALYVEQKICALLTPVGLAVKLPEETKNHLLKSKRAVPLRYFQKAPIKKEYVLFSDGVAEGRALHQYLKESIEYVLAMPKPSKSKASS